LDFNQLFWNDNDDAILVFNQWLVLQEKIAETTVSPIDKAIPLADHIFNDLVRHGKIEMIFETMH
jgi:hypothetical protein